MKGRRRREPAAASHEVPMASCSSYWGTCVSCGATPETGTDADPFERWFGFGRDARESPNRYTPEPVQEIAVGILRSE